MNIFVATGTQKFQFDRLLREVDGIAEKHPDYLIFAQTGASTYKPQHYSFQKFLDKQQFDEQVGKADVVITHGGAGIIVESIKQGKKVIAVPRKQEFSEHVDDHQEEIVSAFVEAGYILACEDVSELEGKIAEAISFNPKPFISNTQHFIECLKAEIEKC